MAFIEGLNIPFDITKEQIEHITEVVFFDEVDVTSSELLFIFGCPDPKIWEVACNLYSDRLIEDIVITGGYNSNPKMPMKNWNYGEVAESEVIKNKLLERGIPDEHIYIETKSRNSHENVMYALEVYDFTKIKSMTFIAKEMAVGRQYRTLRKNIPKNIEIKPFPYEAYLGEYRLDRHNWYKNTTTRDFIFDEYLRNILYGKKGDISQVKNIDEELEKYIFGFLDS